VDDPFDPLTLPEVLACAELAAADLHTVVTHYVPGSHLLRISDLRRARLLWGWYRHGQNAYWLLAALVDPVQTAARFLLSRGLLSPLFERVRHNLLLWFHTLFIFRLGYYLIELYSGRLQGGAVRYRQWLGQTRPGHAPSVSTRSRPASLTVSDSVSPPPAVGPEALYPLTILVVGPRGAGKSHLIEAWHQAVTEQTEASEHTTAPTATPPTDREHTSSRSLDYSSWLLWFEAPGFGADPSGEDLERAADKLTDADLVLLVTAATSPGRQWELRWLQHYRDYFACRPHLRRPPLLVALTHVDLLPPATQWQPPYDWRQGTRQKEQAIRECVQFVAQQLGVEREVVVPLAVRQDQSWGVWEELWPAIFRQIPLARSAALLRQMHTEMEQGRWRQVRQQIRHLWEAIRTQWTQRQ
jgi:predicted GTPase